MQYLISSGVNRSVDREHGPSRFSFWRDVISEEYVKLECEPVSRGSREYFSGTVRSGVPLGQVRCSEVIADPQVALRTKKQIAEANEDDFLISFQLKSNCVVRQSGRQTLLTPGSFALYDSTAPYSLSFEEEFHQLVLQMPRDVLMRHLLEPEKHTATAISATCGIGLILQTFVFSLMKELSASQDSPNELLAENLVNLIALSLSSSVTHSKLAELTSVREALVRRIYQFIDANLFDPGLTNLKVAESQGVSIRYLHKVFENETETVHEHILNRRLSAAQSLLKEREPTRNTIEQIALHVGFSSASHFSRAFKSRFGCCPSEWADSR